MPLPVGQTEISHTVTCGADRDKHVVTCGAEIIIIHKFSTALFPAERAQRACSHTCT